MCLQVEPEMTRPQKALRYAGKVLLYGAAACSALERVNDDKHFASDIALGSTIGFLSANAVANRRARIGIAADDDQVMVYLVKEF